MFATQLSRIDTGKKKIVAIGVAVLLLTTGTAGAQAALSSGNVVSLQYATSAQGVGSGKDLAHATVSGTVFIFVNSGVISRVTYFVDDATGASQPTSTATASPFILSGTVAAGGTGTGSGSGTGGTGTGATGTGATGSGTGTGDTGSGTGDSGTGTGDTGSGTGDSGSGDSKDSGDASSGDGEKDKSGGDTGKDDKSGGDTGKDDKSGGDKSKDDKSSGDKSDNFNVVHTANENKTSDPDTNSKGDSGSKSGSGSSGETPSSMTEEQAGTGTGTTGGTGTGTGTSGTGTTNPFGGTGGASSATGGLDTTALANGVHTVLAEITASNGNVTDLFARFMVQNSGGTSTGNQGGSGTGAQGKGSTTKPTGGGTGTTGGAGTAGTTPAAGAGGAAGGTGSGATAAAAFNWGQPTKSSTFDSLDGWSRYSAPNDFGHKSPENISVSNGIVTIKGSTGGNTGGMANNSMSSKFGRWETRAKTTSDGKCWRPVLLLWPDAENFPVGGEIDYAENGGDGLDKVEFFLHYGSSNSQKHGSTSVDQQQWHNYAVEWTANHIVGYVDGKQFFESTDKSTLPPGPMHPTIQLDGSAGCNANTQFQVDSMNFYPVS